MKRKNNNGVILNPKAHDLALKTENNETNCVITTDTEKTQSMSVIKKTMTGRCNKSWSQDWSQEAETGLECQTADKSTFHFCNCLLFS